MEKIKISHFSDIGLAKRKAKELAVSVGFDETASYEIALVVNELASNIINHAKSGMLNFYPLSDDNGLRIESLDQGPGIADIERAVTDGFSTIGSLGYGLGTINRLMDNLQINSRNGAGGLTQILCERRMRNLDYNQISNHLDIGVATRPYPGFTINGDSFVIKQWNKSALIAVIDGLGHGQFAHKAAQRARQYVEFHFDQPMLEIFRGVERSCRATRGVVMALARFDLSQETFTFANIGNIEPRIIGATEPIKLVVRRGIIGVNSPKPVITTHPWRPSHIIILHTDGIISHWDSSDFSSLWNRPANIIAQELQKALAKDTDDATIVVVKGRKAFG